MCLCETRDADCRVPTGDGSGFFNAHNGLKFHDGPVSRTEIRRDDARVPRVRVVPLPRSASGSMSGRGSYTSLLLLLARASTSLYFTLQWQPTVLPTYSRAPLGRSVCNVLSTTRDRAQTSISLLGGSSLALTSESHPTLRSRYYN